MLSLFFELTQLTALYGIYPKPYHLFDVDDLMLNTLGGIIGFFIYKHFLFFLPSREKIDERKIRASEKVSYTRRIFAFGIDYSITFFIANIIMNIAKLHLSILTFNFILFGYLIVSHLLFKQTIGKMLVHIKLQPIKGYKYYSLSIIMRYMILFIIFSTVEILDFFVKHTYANGIFAIIELLFLLVIAIDTIIGLKREKTLFYEKLTKTYNVNTKKIKR